MNNISNFQNTTLFMPTCATLTTSPIKTAKEAADNWKADKKEKAEIEIQEASTFWQSIKIVWGQFKPILENASNKDKKNIINKCISGAKNALKDEWEYFKTGQAKLDAKNIDFIHNKKLCNATAQMSKDVYNSEQSTVDGWEPFEKVENLRTGLKAVAYKKDKNIVIAYCGTNDPKDFISDAQMAAGQIPEQFTQADKFLKRIIKKNPENYVMVTGHSLGGSLAELVASKNRETSAITFNAYGVDNLIKSNPKLKLRDNKNSFNYIIEGDPVSNSSKHVGETTMLTKTAINNHSVANYISVWA